MIVSWINIDGLKAKISSLEDIDNFLDSDEFGNALIDIRSFSKLFWSSHVYDYFDARSSHGLSNTGQLGKSLRVGKGTHRMVMTMAKIYNTSGDETVEYGHYLREGFGPSIGAYHPRYDARVRTGVHPGYDASTRWEPWVNRFRNEVHEYSGLAVTNAWNDWKDNNGL